MPSDYLYIDTSVYLGILLGESSALEFQPKLRGKQICSSILLLMESERNLVRMSREKIISSDIYQKAIEQLRQDAELFVFKGVDARLCLNGQYPPVQIPRSNDLVHLRTAKWFMDQENLAGFLTLDKTQREAALEFGLPVLKPQ